MTFLPHELLLMVAVEALGHGHHWDIELHTPRRDRRVAMTACVAIPVAPSWNLPALPIEHIRRTLKMIGFLKHVYIALHVRQRRLACA